jgi:hypothetical protein
MFQRSARSRSRAISADIGEIEHRLRTLEKHLERIGGNTSRNAAQAVDRIGETADRVAETVASALSTMADRFRGKASSVSDQAGKMGNEAALPLGWGFSLVWRAAATSRRTRPAPSAVKSGCR